MTKLTGELKVNEADSSGLTPLYFAVVSKKASDFLLNSTADGKFESTVAKCHHEQVVP